MTIEVARERQGNTAVGLLAVLGIPDFRSFWLAGGLNSFGRWMDQVLLGWITLVLTDSAWLVALTAFYRNVPMLLASAVAGVAGDRFGRRRVSLVAQVVAAATCAGLGLLLLTERLTFTYLSIGALGLGLASALDFPTRRALIGDLVEPSALLDAVYLEILTQNAMRMLGPLAAGIVLAGIDPGTGYVVDGAAYALAFVLLSRVHLKRATGRGVSQGLGFREGLQTLRSNRPVLGVVVITFTMNLLVFPIQQLLPVFARDTLHVNALGLGMLAAAIGFGTVVGVFILSRLPQAAQGKVFLFGSLAMVVLVIIFAASREFWLALWLLIAAGVGQAGFGTMQSAIVLHATPVHLRGRALGWTAVAIGAGPLGMLGMGALATMLGVPPAIAVTSTVALVVVALATAALPDLRRYGWGRQ
ncbi:MAG: MFS transporter [Chloroflexi bacterium]|nr:MFS transporter [Chloroflexota bacterium]